ncbi:hypothetical protein [Natronosalvus vescus]|uniref:hypothetical protein n=1 Tax=Natronosalvus vescus TaxID=2953881 RepID=UPI0020900322|nr:hypothetical protein [Natronosalvus vescus]
MYCQQCGEELSSQRTFCTDCGSSGGGTAHESRGSTEIVGGLEEHVAGTLCYLFGFVTGIVFLLLEDRNEFVRFHAAQSTLVFGGLFAIGIGLNIAIVFLELIPGIGWLFAAGFGLMMALSGLLIGPIVFILWLVLMLKAYRGDRFALPVVGEIAERYV